MSTAEIAAYEAGYRAGQEDMRQRAAGCTGFDVYGIGNCVRINILALPLKGADAAPDVPVGIPPDP